MARAGLAHRLVRFGPRILIQTRAAAVAHHAGDGEPVRFLRTVAIVEPLADSTLIRPIAFSHGFIDHHNARGARSIGAVKETAGFERNTERVEKVRTYLIHRDRA